MKPLVLADSATTRSASRCCPVATGQREETFATLRSLKDQGLVRGAVWLQTCNRPSS
jgi:glutamyl-tRNA reductase